MTKENINRIRVNKVLYKKELITENPIITAEFIIVNNKIVTTPLKVKNNVLQPSIILPNNELLHKYVVGLFSQCADIGTFNLNGNHLEIECVSSKFDTSNIICRDANNIIQYKLNDEDGDEVTQFFKKDNPEYEDIEIKTQKKEFIAYEERLFINFSKGFLFSIINNKYKILYIYCEGQNQNLATLIGGECDIGPLSRFFKFWPELKPSGVKVEENIYLRSPVLSGFMRKRNISNCILYLCNKSKSNKYTFGIPYAEVEII